MGKNDGTPRIYSGMSNEVNPQETLEKRLKITNLYELGVGKYKLSISKEIRVTYGSVTKIEPTTNQVEIEVTEKTPDN